MSVRADVVEKAVAEAKRFIEAVETLDRMQGSQTKTWYPEHHYDGGQYTAAVKRASMDLTKSLVAVRRGL